MNSLHINDRIKALIDFRSANDEIYSIHSELADVIDMKHHFNVFIAGRVNEAHKNMIYQAIVFTWNITAYQTKSFIQYYTRNYQFTFVPSNDLNVDIDGKLLTKITYFISSNGKYTTRDDFEMLPQRQYLQDSMQKYDLPYYLLEDDDESVQSYSRLYFIDFDGYIDPSEEQEIKQIILNSFRKAYPGLLIVKI
jgi:hypothetical protein